ncbi:MAG: PQQ-binding-like beta-propeller repeat protein [Actinobacteria bacterium]|nr:PQQ-binding-like beta-propeller repeat protein [Actinomycetota bacterium]
MANKNRLCLTLVCLVAAAVTSCSRQQAIVIEGQALSDADRFRSIHLEPYWTNNDLELAAGEKVEKVWLEPKSIYCLTSLNKLYRLDRDKGIVTWIRQPAEPPRVVRRPAEAADKTLVIAHDVVKVYELESGNLVQELALDFSANSDPAFDGERLFVADSVDRVIAIELATGIKIWNCRADKAISAQPMYLERALVAVSESGEVMAYDTEFGQSLWYEHFRTRGPLLSSPVLTDNAIYVAGTDSILYCLRNSGDIRWKYFAGTSLQTPPRLADGRVFQQVPGKGLVVLNAKDGTELKDFQFADGKQYVGTVNDRLYILLENGKIVSVDAQNGQRLVELGVEDFDFFLSDDKKPYIYLANSEGRIVCLGKLGAGSR